MHRKLFAVLFLLLVPTFLVAQNSSAPASPPQVQGGPPRGGRGGPALPANQPAPRDDNRHKGFLEIAQRGNIDLRFVGDSLPIGFRILADRLRLPPRDWKSGTNISPNLSPRILE